MFVHKIASLLHYVNSPSSISGTFPKYASVFGKITYEYDSSSSRLSFNLEAPNVSLQRMYDNSGWLTTYLVCSSPIYDYLLTCPYKFTVHGFSWEYFFRLLSYLWIKWMHTIMGYPEFQIQRRTSSNALGKLMLCQNFKKFCSLSKNCWAFEQDGSLKGNCLLDCHCMLFQPILYLTLSMNLI
jgi:hypothetical protein